MSMHNRVLAALLIGGAAVAGPAWAEEVGIEFEAPAIGEEVFPIEKSIDPEEEISWIEPWLVDGDTPEDEWIYWCFPVDEFPVDEGAVEPEPLPVDPIDGSEVLPDEVLVDPIDGWIVDGEYGWPTGEEIPPYVRYLGGDDTDVIQVTSGPAAATAPTPTALIAGAALLAVAAARSRRSRA